MFDKIIKIMYLMLCVFSSILIFVFLNCKSFKPIQIEGQPPECNDMYTIMKITIDEKKSLNPFTKKEKTDYSVLLLLIEDCRQVRREIRKNDKEIKCKKRVYGKGPVVREEYKKYADFSDCMRE